jgi:hypothetical protein
MVEKASLRKLILDTNILNNKLELIKSLDKMKLLTLLVLLKVKVSPVLSKDGVLDIFKRNLTEVTEKLVVLELGIHLVLPGP